MKRNEVTFRTVKKWPSGIGDLLNEVQAISIFFMKRQEKGDLSIQISANRMLE
jgi:hypothetical protein